MKLDEPVVNLPSAFAHRFEGAENVETFNTRIGRCYELSLRAQLTMSIWGWETVLVHGTIGPHNNPHAWLEWRDDAGRRWSWDAIEDGIMPSARYKIEMYAVVWTRYTSRRAATQIARDAGNGPWGKRNKDLAIKAIEGMIAAGIKPDAGRERIKEIQEESDGEK